MISIYTCPDQKLAHAASYSNKVGLKRTLSSQRARAPRTKCWGAAAIPRQRSNNHEAWTTLDELRADHGVLHAALDVL